MKTLKSLFFLTVLIFPLGQLASFNLNLWGFIFRFSLFELGIILFVFYWLILFKKKQFPFFSKPLIIFFILAFFSYLIKASTFNSTQTVTCLLYLTRLILWIIFPIACFNLFKKENVFTDKIFLFEVIVLSSISVLQYFFLPDTRFLYSFGWDDHLYRAVGSFLDPAFNGLILIFGYIYVLKNYLVKKNFKSLLLVLFVIFSITLTFSRMSYVLLIISSFVLLLPQKKYKLALGLISLTLLIVALLPKPAGEGVDLTRKSSIFAKKENYQQIWNISRENLLTGIGYNNLRFELHKRGILEEKDWRESHSGSGSDNSFLFVLVTTGIFGLSSFLYLWSVILKQSWIFKKTQIYFLSLNLCLLLSAFLVNSLFYSWVLWWWGISLAKFTAETAS